MIETILKLVVKSSLVLCVRSLLLIAQPRGYLTAFLLKKFLICVLLEFHNLNS
jgi:hypothetical protein